MVTVTVGSVAGSMVYMGTSDTGDTGRGPPSYRRIPPMVPGAMLGGVPGFLTSPLAGRDPFLEEQLLRWSRRNT